MSYKRVRPLHKIGARVPVELQDELGLLYDRGYSSAEIVKEGIRCCSDKEGLLVRRRETALARPPFPIG